MNGSHSVAEFPSTIWSLVVRAGNPTSPEAREALARLCEAYWYPIYALIRHRGNPADKALDLTQAFFVRVLEKGKIGDADRAKGRFRTFLRLNCTNFLIDEHRRMMTEANGGGRLILSIDACDAEGHYSFEPIDTMTSERLFERTWALTLLGRVLELLAREYEASGRAETFEHLKVVLTEGRGAVRGAVLAGKLGISEDAVYTATHRLKARYREILKEQIAATLDDPSEIKDEIRSLFDAIRP
jgi:DNA-directed RNA polymerase specialized sigma24 family protein